MSNVTFRQGNILSSQLSSKTGNLSQLLFRQNEKRAGSTKVTPLAPILEETNPYSWNSKSASSSENGESRRFDIFMDQARMSTYYQDHPWGGLEHSSKNGYTGPTLGGDIRNNVPPGYLPGNTQSKPTRNIKTQMATSGGFVSEKSTTNTTNKESFGNIDWEHTVGR